MAKYTTKILESVRSVFSEFLSNEVPKKVSNVLWSLYAGVQGMFEHLEWKVDLFIRERNLLTATHKSSLRTIAAENGFEPSLMIPAEGILKLNISQTAYNKYGYPLYLPPYATFTCKDNNLKYYYNNDVALPLVSQIYNIPVVQGELKGFTVTGTGDSIQRIYVKDHNISNNSIIIAVDGVLYEQVNSFFDNQGYNYDRQYVIKYSRNIQTPFIIYIKNVQYNQKIEVRYRVNYGEVGNLAEVVNFETEDIINQFGDEVSLKADELEITNVSGFNYGSEGSDENSFRSAIGYNHGNILLFDNASYNNFLSRFSTLMIQKIEVNEDTRQQNEIYLYRKIVINGDTTYTPIEYKRIISNEEYVLSGDSLDELNNILYRNEYCLSSHNLHKPDTLKYAFQIAFNNIYDKENYSQKIEILLYTEFSKFLYDKYHKINIDTLLSDYKKNNNVEFDYYMFIEGDNDVNHICSNYKEIVHTDKLPILRGDFDIMVETDSSTSQTTEYRLYMDINFVLNA